MDRTELLQMVRAYLEETTEVFYLDDEEIYPALTEAQKEIINRLGQQWWKENIKKPMSPVPQCLKPLVTASNATLSSGIWNISGLTTLAFPLYVIWSPDGTALGTYPSSKQCAWVTDTEFQMLKHNTLTTDSHFAFWDTNDSLAVNPPSSSGTSPYKVWFVKYPTNDIDASNDPEIGVMAHTALVHRALWLLLKDRELQHAQLHQQMYENLFGALK